MNIVNPSSPQVSLIVPIYGVEKYIERCARSIFKQTCKDIEVIFVNDCTPDRSIEILRRVLAEYPDWQSRTRIIEHEHNKGSAGARITGLEAAMGCYVLQIDSDDYIACDMVEKMLAAARTTDADITICDYSNVYSDKIIRESINPPLEPIECMRQVLVGQLHAALWNKLIRVELYRENNIMFTQELNFSEDLSVMYKLFYFARTVAYVPEAYYYYNKVNLASYTAVANIKKAYQESFMVLLRQMDSFRQTHQSPMPLDIDRAFDFYKAQIKSYFLLVGEDISFAMADEFQAVSVQDILQHPTLRWWFKAAGFCGHYRCMVGVSVLRWLYKQGKGLKRWMWQK